MTSVGVCKPIEEIVNNLITIESAGNNSAIGDNGKAVGCLQIHPIMVRDVNRILGKEVYTLSDRLSRQKSVEMASIYFNHYCKGDTEEQMVRKWNGGPKGDRKKSTIKYWKKYQTVSKYDII